MNDAATLERETKAGPGSAFPDLKFEERVVKTTITVISKIPNASLARSTKELIDTALDTLGAAGDVRASYEEIR